ncbi:SpoIIE family protein phosphatase [Streptomyces carpinensis]|nr:SpoIIE family protein phosphatase [Streptomyces carpinensis]
MTDRSGSPDEPGARQQAHVVIDRRGRVVEWDSQAEALLGYPGEEALGRSAADLLGALAAGVSAAAGDGPAVVLRRRDGGLLTCRLTVTPDHAGDAGTRLAVAISPVQPEEQGRPDELERALLETLFTLSPTGLYLLDPQLRVIRFNVAAEGMQGTSVEEAAGRRPREVWPGFAAAKVERVMARVLATGQPAIGVEKRMRPPGDPHHDHVYSTSVFRLEDAQGRILGLADATVDVTDLHLAQERLTVLARASDRIGSTLDALDTARGLAEVSVPVLADSIAVDVVQAVLAGEDVEPGPVRPGAVLRRAASRSRNDQAPGTGTDQDGDLPPVSTAGALAGLAPRLVDPQGPEGEPMLRCLWTPAGEEVHSLMVMPLVTQDRTLGLATLCRWGDQRPFEPGDLTLAGELARRTAACLDNARRHLREHNSLVALQHILGPAVLPSDQALEVAHTYVHAGSGGDWVDVLPLSGARVALVAGRVPGRGIQPAAAAGRLRAAVHTLSELDLEPDELLARLADSVGPPGTADGLEENNGRPRPVPDAATTTHGPDSSATCLYLIYDPVSRRCSVSSAGHPWPVVLHPDGTVRTMDRPLGDTLRSLGAPFGSEEFELPENSTFMLYTPGLLQQEQEQEHDQDQEQEHQHEPPGAGRERLIAQLAGTAGSVQAICTTLTKALVPAHPRDDAALLVARTHALGPSHVASWDLASDPAVVSEARTLAARQLESWDMNDAAFTTELVVSELVTNAIRHGKPPVTLRLVRGHVLTCEVSDGSSTSPRLRHARNTDEGGRGLLLVARCSDRWGTRYTQDGKIVWVEQRLP